MLSLDNHLRRQSLDEAAHAATRTGFESSRRRHGRYPFVRVAVHVRVVAGPGTGTVHILSTRDLGAGGVGLLSGRSFAPGARLSFLRDHGAPLLGTVVHCTPFDDGLHVVGVEFDGPINPFAYVDPNF